MKEKRLCSFDAPKIVVSDNATCFTSQVLHEFIKFNRIKWKLILAYAEMSISRAEKMVGTNNRAINFLAD